MEEERAIQKRLIYEIEDSGGLGELDVRWLIKQLGDTRLAENIARGWRGGSYLAVKRKPAQ